jgi:TusA-related sulfurtransferase
VSDVRIDMLGRLCPLPIIELARRITDVAVGETVTVIADDPAAASDVPAWCRMRGHDYLGATPEAQGTAYQFRRTR